MIFVLYMYLMSFFPPMAMWFVGSFLFGSVVVFLYQVSKLFRGD